MNYDEFAFFNQQLAAMLRDGIPLEGALARLSKEMRQGELRSEFEKLTTDLAKGFPLGEAARVRKFPELFRQLLEVGQASNDLPAVLTLLADYYHRRHLIWTRLKGLMVYPIIVLCCAFLLSIFLSLLSTFFVKNNFLGLLGFGSVTPSIFFCFWLAPVVLALAATLAGVASPALRRRLRWRLPAFKEASVAQVGCAMALMLKSGVPLNDALGLAASLEEGTPAQPEINRWREQMAAGRGKFGDMAAGSGLFPPLFVWMVGHAGEDLSAGFAQASDLYQSRATYRTEMLLYSALPCAVLALGLMVLSQVTPVVAQFVNFLKELA